MSVVGRKFILRPGQIDECHYDRIESVIVEVSRSLQYSLNSCIDIGCGLRPANDWFAKISNPGSKFVGVDTDEKIIGELRSRGIDAVSSLNFDRTLVADLVLAKEVIEHLRPTETESFLESCKRSTVKLFALTTPNFEYWRSQRAIDKGLRWVPDHFKDFRPGSSNPHHHKQEMTPELVAERMRKTFGSDEWSWSVLRTWP